MTQKTTPEGVVYFCDFCGRDNFKSRQAAAAHEKVCAKNPANITDPAPAKNEQTAAPPAKDEQEDTAKAPFVSPSAPDNVSSPDSSSSADNKAAPIQGGKSDAAVLSGDEPAFPVGVVIIIFVLVGVGIAIVMLKDQILKFWQEIVGGDDDGRSPPAVPAV